RHSSLLPDILRDWYFLAGVTVAFAPLTAYALDDYLAGESRRVPAWLAPMCLGLMASWAGYELYRWRMQSLAIGWRSAIDLLATLVVFSAAMHTFRAERGRTRVWMAA